MLKLFLTFMIYFICLMIKGASIHEYILVNVNNHIITAEEFKQKINSLDINISYTHNKEHILQNLIDDYILIDKANELGILIDDNLISDNLEAIKQEYDFKSNVELEAAIENNLHINLSSYVKTIKKKILETLLVQHELHCPILISYEELSNYYNNNKINYIEPASYCIRELVLNADDQVTNNIVSQELAKKTNFENLISLYSISTTRDNNGKLGWIKQRLLHPILGNIINSSKKNQIIGPIKLDNKTYFLQIIDSKPNKIKKFNEVQKNIIDQLSETKTKDLINNNIISLRNKANVEYITAKDKIISNDHSPI